MMMHLPAESVPHHCLSTQLDASEFRAAIVGVKSIPRRDVANLLRDVSVVFFPRDETVWHEARDLGFRDRLCHPAVGGRNRLPIIPRGPDRRDRG